MVPRAWLFVLVDTAPDTRPVPLSAEPGPVAATDVPRAALFVRVKMCENFKKK
jgi:hypothetical protein